MRFILLTICFLALTISGRFAHSQTVDLNAPIRGLAETYQRELKVIRDRERMGYGSFGTYASDGAVYQATERALGAFSMQSGHYFNWPRKLTAAERAKGRSLVADQLQLQFTPELLANAAERIPVLSAPQSMNRELVRMRVLAAMSETSDAALQHRTVDVLLSLMPKAVETVHQYSEHVSDDQYAGGDNGRRASGLSSTVYVALINALERSIAAQDSVTMNRVLDLFSNPAVMNGFMKTIGGLVFAKDAYAPEAERARYFLGVFAVQRREALRSFYQWVEQKDPNAKPAFWGETNRRAVSEARLVRFYFDRDISYLRAIIEGSPRWANPTAAESFMNLENFDLVKSLAGQPDLKEMLIVKELYRYSPLDRYTHSNHRSAYIEAIRRSGGTVGVTTGAELLHSVARRVFEADPSLTNRRGLGDFFLDRSDSTLPSPKADFQDLMEDSQLRKMRTAALRFMLIEGIFTLKDFDLMIREMKRGTEWTLAFHASDSPHSLWSFQSDFQQKLQELLKARGYVGAEGLGRYLGEHHGLKPEILEPHSDGKFGPRSALAVAETGRMIPSWKFYDLAFSGLTVQVAERSAQSRESYATFNRYIKPEDLPRYQASYQSMLTGLKAGGDAAVRGEAAAKSAAVLRCEGLFR